MQSNMVNAACLHTEQNEKKQNISEKSPASGKNRAVLSCYNIKELPGMRSQVLKTANTCANDSMSLWIPLHWGAPHVRDDGSSYVTVFSFFRSLCQLLQLPNQTHILNVWTDAENNLTLDTKQGLAAFAFHRLSFYLF